MADVAVADPKVKRKRRIEAGCLVLVRNGADIGLDRCLASIRAADMTPILLDDESTDDTYLVAGRHRAAYRYHSAEGRRSHEIWQTTEHDLRQKLADFAMEFRPTLLATLDADEWFMSPKTVGAIAHSMLDHAFYDVAYFRTVNFWDDMEHVKVFPHDPYYARPRIWRVDPALPQIPIGKVICTQAPEYVGDYLRGARQYNICVGHTGYLSRAVRLAKSRRYCELGAGQWAREFASDHHVMRWDPSILKGLP